MGKEEKPGRILLTGSQGSIGSLILRSLCKRHPSRISVLDVTKPSRLPKGVIFNRVDLSEPAVDGKIARIMERDQIDTVIHSALFWSPTHSSTHAHEVEVIGTIHLLNACQQQNIRKLILMSSTLVYGARPTHPNYLLENYPLRQNDSSGFVRDKVEVEEGIRKFRLRNPKTTVTVLRPCMIVGPTIQNFVTEILSRPVVLTMLGYDPLIQFVHENDLLHAVRLALTKEGHGEFNIVGSGVFPLSYAIKLAGRVNLPMIDGLARPLFSLLWYSNVSSFPPDLFDFLKFLWIADGTKAARELGFTPRFSSKEALESFLGQKRFRHLHLIKSTSVREAHA